jgi:hypothetical protein
VEAEPRFGQRDQAEQILAGSWGICQACSWVRRAGLTATSNTLRRFLSLFRVINEVTNSRQIAAGSITIRAVPNQFLAARSARMPGRHAKLSDRRRHTTMNALIDQEA